jgi:hypothetical protein
MSADVGLRNGGDAMNTTVHGGQLSARDREAAEEDAEVARLGGPTPSGTPTASTGTTTTTMQP